MNSEKLKVNNEINDEYPEKFTVKEMIEVLQKFPPDMRIVTQGIKNGYENVFQPEIITVYRNEESMPEYEGEYDVNEINGQLPIEVVVICRNDVRD